MRALLFLIALLISTPTFGINQAPIPTGLPSSTEIFVAYYNSLEFHFPGVLPSFEGYIEGKENCHLVTIDRNFVFNYLDSNSVPLKYEICFQPDAPTINAKIIKNFEKLELVSKKLARLNFITYTNQSLRVTEPDGSFSIIWIGHIHDVDVTVFP